MAEIDFIVSRILFFKMERVHNLKDRGDMDAFILSPGQYILQRQFFTKSYQVMAYLQNKEHDVIPSCQDPSKVGCNTNSNHVF